MAGVRSSVAELPRGLVFGIFEVLRPFSPGTGGKRRYTVRALCCGRTKVIYESGLRRGPKRCECSQLKSGVSR
jgi:hypothetical protein